MHTAADAGMPLAGREQRGAPNYAALTRLLTHLRLFPSAFRLRLARGRALPDTTRGAVPERAASRGEMRCGRSTRAGSSFEWLASHASLPVLRVLFRAASAHLRPRQAPRLRWPPSRPLLPPLS